MRKIGEGALPPFLERVEQGKTSVDVATAHVTKLSRFHCGAGTVYALYECRLDFLANVNSRSLSPVRLSVCLFSVVCL